MYDAGSPKTTMRTQIRLKRHSPSCCFVIANTITIEEMGTIAGARRNPRNRLRLSKRTEEFTALFPIAPVTHCPRACKPADQLQLSTTASGKQEQSRPRGTWVCSRPLWRDMFLLSPRAKSRGPMNWSPARGRFIFLSHGLCPTTLPVLGPQTPSPIAEGSRSPKQAFHFFCFSLDATAGGLRSYSYSSQRRHTRLHTAESSYSLARRRVPTRQPLDQDTLRIRPTVASIPSRLQALRPLRPRARPFPRASAH